MTCNKSNINVYVKSLNQNKLVLTVLSKFQNKNKLKSGKVCSGLYNTLFDTCLKKSNQKK